jgi:micrococcal nuclease
MIQGRPRTPLVAGGAFGLFVGVATSLACDGAGSGSDCGPTRAVVERVIDGDTVELEGGTRLRYLMVDTPESTNGADDCYGQESSDFNRDLVEGKEITIAYDVECTDAYDRILGYVQIQGRDVNRLLVERGLACVLHIPPNGEDVADEYRDLEEAARIRMVGLWAACEDVTCD